MPAVVVLLLTTTGQTGHRISVQIIGVEVPFVSLDIQYHRFHALALVADIGQIRILMTFCVIITDVEHGVGMVIVMSGPGV